MKYKFPYEFADLLNIPDENLIGVFSENVSNKKADCKVILEKAIYNPIGTARIKDEINDKSKVLILCDDNTRATPVHEILALVFKELEYAGVSGDNVKILVALGTHRPMTEEEINIKFGKETAAKINIVNHCWKDRRNLVYIGSIENGIKIYCNELVKWADYIIGIGSISPHAVAGYSGGGKIVVPGICGEETSGDMHWLMADIPPEKLYGVIENPVRKAIDEIALKAGLKFIINCIINSNGEVEYAVAGHPVKAHRVGCEYSRRVHGVRIKSKADIVIFDSYKSDIEYWQAIKAVTPAGIVMNEGGIAIQVAGCMEGISKSHPEVLKYGYKDVDSVKKLLEEGKINKIVAAHMIQASYVIKNKGQGFLISPNIKKEDILKLGFLYSDSVEQALKKAFELKGRNASVLVLRKASSLLPVLE